MSCIPPPRYSGNPFLSWNLPSDSGLQSIISLTFPDLTERYLEKKDEMIAYLTRETGGLSSPDAAVQRRRQFLDISCMHCWPDGCGFLGAMNGNHIKVSGICRSGLHFLGNHHSNSVVTGRVWLLPLTQLLAELSITVFLKCAWS